MPLDARVAALEHDVGTLRAEASRYRSDIAVRDELYSRTGSVMLSFLHMLPAQLRTYRDTILGENKGTLPPAALAAFDTFLTSLIAELGEMAAQYETVFTSVAQIIGGAG